MYRDLGGSLVSVQSQWQNDELSTDAGWYLWEEPAVNQTSVWIGLITEQTPGRQQQPS